MVSLRSAPEPGPAPAAKTTASAPAIAAASSSASAFSRSMHDRLASSRGDMLGMGGIADEREDAVAPLGEELREEQSDLSVPACDRYDHAPDAISGHR